jgi:hypothetical protein
MGCKINKKIIILKTETLTNDMHNIGFEDFNINDNVTKRNKINYFDLFMLINS